MTIEALAERYIELCNKHGLTNVKSIDPVEYQLNTCQHRIIDGTLKMKVTTYTEKFIVIEHINEVSYANNLQILKSL